MGKRWDYFFAGCGAFLTMIGILGIVLLTDPVRLETFFRDLSFKTVLILVLGLVGFTLLYHRIWHGKSK